MGFSFRKSFKAGPLRVNFSKSGVGASVGVKGARIGLNSRGKAYVVGGAYGITFRQTLGAGQAAAAVPGHAGAGVAAAPSVAASAEAAASGTVAAAPASPPNRGVKIAMRVVGVFLAVIGALLALAAFSDRGFIPSALLFVSWSVGVFLVVKYRL